MGFKACQFQSGTGLNKARDHLLRRHSLAIKHQGAHEAGLLKTSHGQLLPGGLKLVEHLVGRNKLTSQASPLKTACLDKMGSPESTEMSIGKGVHYRLCSHSLAAYPQLVLAAVGQKIGQLQ